MRALLLAALLLFAPLAHANVVEEVATNNYGQPFIRLHNNLSVYVSCYYSDAYNYFTFVIPPYTTTTWNPIYGAYVWECRS